MYSDMCFVCSSFALCFCSTMKFFFFQAEDGIRDAQESRGLGDVYKRQVHDRTASDVCRAAEGLKKCCPAPSVIAPGSLGCPLSLIHI